MSKEYGNKLFARFRGSLNKDDEIFFDFEGTITYKNLLILIFGFFPILYPFLFFSKK